MADAVYGGLVAAGWPPARATHIGALMRYLVAGSALGSFARGFVPDPDSTPPTTPTSARPTGWPTTSRASTRARSPWAWRRSSTASDHV